MPAWSLGVIMFRIVKSSPRNLDLDVEEKRERERERERKKKKTGGEPCVTCSNVSSGCLTFRAERPYDRHSDFTETAVRDAMRPGTDTLITPEACLKTAPATIDAAYKINKGIARGPAIITFDY